MSENNVKFMDAHHPLAVLREALRHEPTTVVLAYTTADGDFRTVTGDTGEPGRRLRFLGLASQLLHDIGATE